MEKAQKKNKKAKFIQQDPSSAFLAKGLRSDAGVAAGNVG